MDKHVDFSNKSCAHQKEDNTNSSFGAHLSSSLVLSCIALVGIFGNILVLLVYCVKQKPTYSQSTRQRLEAENGTRNKGQQTFTTQRYLIIVLATVDLLTCIFILPWDLLKSIERTAKLQYFEKYHSLNDFFSELRNIVFACEGSIFAAIALDRFLTVVYASPKIANDKQCATNSICSKCRKYLSNFFPRCAAPEKSSSCVCGKKTESNEIEMEGRCSYNKLDNSIQKNHNCLCCGFHTSAKKFNNKTVCCPNSKSSNEKSSLDFRSKIQRIQPFIVWGSIIFTSATVFLIELVIFIEERSLEQTEEVSCIRLENIRETINMCYLNATIISGLAIFFLYFRVFMLVRHQDSRSKMLRRSNIKSSLPPQLEATNTPLKMPVTPDEEDQVTENNLEERVHIVDTDPTCEQELVIQTPLSDEKASSNIRQRLKRFRDVLCARRRSQRSRRTGLMLFISTVFFYATLLPVFLEHYDNRSGSPFVIHHEFYYLNNAINVIIYSGLNPNFRSRLHNLRKSYM
ncbi:hypothetical protein Ciccas_011563 [Cichlidogyrus casuarinus]|uniref:G-protein coupled receptors family 1 profile domain-containing protein n=1 Tax=Cichlidogyrus casuarinus TaxID=1844966 RepID=A0ABD2PT06_9PLAT